MANEMESIPEEIFQAFQVWKKIIGEHPSATRRYSSILGRAGDDGKTGSPR